MSFLNLPRVLLAALRNGHDSMSGKTFCPGTGCLEDFGGFDEVMKAWEKQVRFFTRATVETDTAVDTALEENVPDILCSTFVDNCVERGKTLKEGGAKYDFISGLQVGIANLGNSLAAIKELVFGEARIGKAELMAALDSNFEGPQGEKIRQLLLNRAPKYGNDDDFVDLLLRDAYLLFIDELSHFHNTRHGRGPIGGTYYAGTSSISANVPSGSVVPADAGRPQGVRAPGRGMLPVLRDRHPGAHGRLQVRGKAADREDLRRRAAEPEAFTGLPELGCGQGKARGPPAHVL